jgi:hypothetical protein
LAQERAGLISSLESATSAASIAEQTIPPAIDSLKNEVSAIGTTTTEGLGKIEETAKNGTFKIKEKLEEGNEKLGAISKSLFDVIEEENLKLEITQDIARQMSFNRGDLKDLLTDILSTTKTLSKDVKDVIGDYKILKSEVHYLHSQMGTINTNMTNRLGML